MKRCSRNTIVILTQTVPAPVTMDVPALLAHLDFMLIRLQKAKLRCDLPSGWGQGLGNEEPLVLEAQ